MKDDPNPTSYPQKSQYTSRYRLNLARQSYRKRIKQIIKIREGNSIYEK
jgi:hypothetical protein